ncbi:hypothetical protein [Brevibacillus panacihumi]|nr:hypothetical protein [Brevibacillus panacihumi]
MSKKRMHNKVKKKLFGLFAGEWFAALMFAVLWVLYLYLLEGFEVYLTSAPSLYAFVLLEWILLQGGYYWFLKWRQVKNKSFSSLPDHQLRLFAFFKKSNLLLICIGILVLIYQCCVFAADFYWFLLLFSFAVIEHINYYHIRLSYMSVEEIKEFLAQKGFRRSLLAKELKKYHRAQVKGKDGRPQ